MTSNAKEERRLRFLERQRAVTAADQASRGYQQVKASRRRRRELTDENRRQDSGFDDRFGTGDNLGESHD